MNDQNLKTLLYENIPSVVVTSGAGNEKQKNRCFKEKANNIISKRQKSKTMVVFSM